MGEGGGAIKALLVDVGLPCLKYSESFAKIRDDEFTFVSLRTKLYLNRSLSLMGAKSIVCASKLILANYNC